MINVKNNDIDFDYVLKNYYIPVVHNNIPEKKQILMTRITKKDNSNPEIDKANVVFDNFFEFAGQQHYLNDKLKNCGIFPFSNNRVGKKELRFTGEIKKVKKNFIRFYNKKKNIFDNDEFNSNSFQKKTKVYILRNEKENNAKNFYFIMYIEFFNDQIKFYLGGHNFKIIEVENDDIETFCKNHVIEPYYEYSFYYKDNEIDSQGAVCLSRIRGNES